MAVRDQLAHNSRLAQSELEEPALAIKTFAPRGGHRIECVRDMAHPPLKTRARFFIRRIAMTAARNNFPIAQTMDKIERTGQFRRECHDFDYLRVGHQFRNGIWIG